MLTLQLGDVVFQSNVRDLQRVVCELKRTLDIAEGVSDLLWAIRHLLKEIADLRSDFRQHAREGDGPDNGEGRFKSAAHARYHRHKRIRGALVVSEVSLQRLHRRRDRFVLTNAGRAKLTEFTFSCLQVHHEFRGASGDINYYLTCLRGHIKPPSLPEFLPLTTLAVIFQTPQSPPHWTPPPRGA